MYGLNVYKKGDSQEFHNHTNSNLSCVYYADVKKDDSRILFKSSPWPMLEYRIARHNSYNFDQVWYKPVKGMLLVFRSDTMHMVEKKVTDGIRISFSYNFAYKIKGP